jgi:cobalt-zinc-cadmium efflux system outer membrane protein
MPMRLSVRAALAAAPLLWARGAYAEPITFTDALSRAVTSAPSLRASSLGIDAARAGVRPAGALPDPKVSVGVTDFPISGPLTGRPDRDNFSMLALGFSQDVPNRVKRQARVQRAEAGVGQSRAEYAVSVRAVRVATAAAWIDLLYAGRKLEALDKLDHELGLDAATADARVASNAARPASALEPAQLQAGLADRRETLKAERAKARAELERWTGAEDAEPVGEAPNIPLDPVVLRAGLDHLPDLELKDAEVRAAEADRGLAKAEKHSDWGYDVEYDHRDPRFGDYVSGKLRFSLPLFAAGRQDPLIAARTTELGRSYADREATRRDLKAALDSDLADHAMHMSLLERARDILVPLARRRVDLETAGYRARTAGLSDVLAARRDLIQVELDRLDREAEAARDGVRIAITYSPTDEENNQ